MGVVPSKRISRTITERHEYVLSTPINSEDVLKTIHQAREDRPARQKATGQVLVSIEDDELVIWWEETKVPDSLDGMD